VHPDFRWQAVQDLDAYEGLDGMKASLAGWDESWEWWKIEAEEFIDAGDAVIIAQRVRGKARQSGPEVDGRYYNICDIREGKLWRMRQFVERMEALEAVGLSEKDLRPNMLARLRSWISGRRS
jgi:ketosteroid isomerase-like protein